jgi:tetraacyldisaccharide-1-P 4'-kinase
MSLQAALERELLRHWYPGDNAFRQGLREAEPSSPHAKRLAAKGLAWLLARSPLAHVLAAVTRLYAHHRQRAIVRPRTQHPPVVVIGNWVVGGGGKTPVVIAIARALRQRGVRVALLSNGYGGTRKGVLEPDRARTGGGYAAFTAGWSDEAALLGLMTGAAVGVGRNRSQALLRLLEADPDLDLILSDDGMQHSGLPRLGEIVVVDPRGLGNHRCLPLGPLREPLASRSPSDWLVLRCPQSAPGQAALDVGAEGLAADGFCQMAHRLQRWDFEAPRVVPWTDWKGLMLGESSLSIRVPPRVGTSFKRAQVPMEQGSAPPPLEQWPRLMEMRDQWQGRKVLAIAGIANPGHLMAQCSQAGIATHWLLPGDHRRAGLPPPAYSADPEVILFTAKDAVKYGDLDERFHVLVQDEAVPAELLTWLEQLTGGSATA